jgi:hypothetical protein
MKIIDLNEKMQSGAMDWKNFSPNASALGYDADMMNFVNYMGPLAKHYGYDADIRNFGGQTALGANGSPSWMAGAPAAMDQKALAAWLNQNVASGAMTTYKLKIYWTAGMGGSPGPVPIVLFDTTFNPGTFDAEGNLVFTNANGDTATVVGLTERSPGVYTTMKQLFSLTETEPFTIGFVRLRPKSVSQLDNAFSIVKESQFGASGTNSMAPDDYVDPYQFQLLRVDVPMNCHASKKHGFAWTINEDQTGNGISMTLFVPMTIDPTKQLSGLDPVRQLNSGVNPQFYMPSAPSGSGQAAANNLAAIASHPMVKTLIASQAPHAMIQSAISKLK